MSRHNKLRGGVDDLHSKAFTPLHVHKNPIIHTYCAIYSVKAHMEGYKVGSDPSLNRPTMAK